jgi:hypothetical protein
MVPENSLSISTEPANGFYSEPRKGSPQPVSLKSILILSSHLGYISQVKASLDNPKTNKRVLIFLRKPNCGEVLEECDNIK